MLIRVRCLHLALSFSVSHSLTTLRQSQFLYEKCLISICLTVILAFCGDLNEQSERSLYHINSIQIDLDGRQSINRQYFYSMFQCHSVSQEDNLMLRGSNIIHLCLKPSIKFTIKIISKFKWTMSLLQSFRLVCFLFAIDFCQQLYDKTSPKAWLNPPVLAPVWGTTLPLLWTSRCHLKSSVLNCWGTLIKRNKPLLSHLLLVVSWAYFTWVCHSCSSRARPFPWERHYGLYLDEKTQHAHIQPHLMISSMVG